MYGVERGYFARARCARGVWQPSRCAIRRSEPSRPAAHAHSAGDTPCKLRWSFWEQAYVQCQSPRVPLVLPDTWPRTQCTGVCSRDERTGAALYAYRAKLAWPPHAFGRAADVGFWVEDCQSGLDSAVLDTYFNVYLPRAVSGPKRSHSVIQLQIDYGTSRCKQLLEPARGSLVGHNHLVRQRRARAREQALAGASILNRPGRWPCEGWPGSPEQLDHVT